MNNIINFISIEDIVHEYSMFESYLHREYDIPVKMSDRILKEVIEKHIGGILDERIFTLFRKYNDDWETTLLDIITASSLDEKSIVKIYNSSMFKRLNSLVSNIVNEAVAGIDRNFTIWSVELQDNIKTALISNDGDYRIEQWHKEHSVTKLNICDNIKLDLSRIYSFIKKQLNYNHAPAYLEVRGKLIPKKDYFSNAVKMIITNCLKDTQQSNRVVDNIYRTLKGLYLIGTSDSVGDIISSYLDFELIRYIDKMTKGRVIKSFVLDGEEIVINLGSNKTITDEVASFSELEVKLAEANGDYIPERLRR